MSKNCIFCGQRGKKSKEHIWPVWMHEYLGKEGDGNHVRESTTFKNREHIEGSKLERQGYLFSTKFRVVCRSCNNGWMSQLEEDTKPVLVKLMKGDKLKLQKADQRLLSRWIAMKVITGEHAEKGLHVTQKDDRLSLKEKGIIPEYFAIYISTHATDAASGWLRISNTISTSISGPNPPLRGLKRNTQSVAIICGKVFIYVFATREKGIESAKFIKMNSLECIHPMDNSELTWPTKKQTSQEEMSRLAWLLNDIDKHPRVRFGGDLPENRA